MRRLWLEETAGGRVRVGIILCERTIPYPRDTYRRRLAAWLWRRLWQWRHPPVRVRRSA